MTIQDPIFGELEWMPQMRLWEGEITLPEMDAPFLLGIEVTKTKAPPPSYQREGFVKFRDAWLEQVRPQVAQKVWDYWKQGVEEAGQFGSIPVDFDKAEKIRSPEELYRTLTQQTLLVFPSRRKLLVLEMRFDWEWDLMGVVVQCVGTQVRNATNFNDDDQDWREGEAA